MTTQNTYEEDLDRLYERVTGAILLAEAAEAANRKADAAALYLEVSFLEEEIARLLPADDAEGVIARCGVVTAAISASQFVRAIDMAERYATESGATAALIQQIDALRSEARAQIEPREPGAVMVDPTAKFRLLAA